MFWCNMEMSKHEGQLILSVVKWLSSVDGYFCAVAHMQDNCRRTGQCVFRCSPSLGHTDTQICRFVDLQYKSSQLPL